MKKASRQPRQPTKKTPIQRIRDAFPAGTPDEGIAQYVEYARTAMPFTVTIMVNPAELTLRVWAYDSNAQAVDGKAALTALREAVRYVESLLDEQRSRQLEEAKQATEMTGPTGPVEVSAPITDKGPKAA